MVRLDVLQALDGLSVAGVGRRGGEEIPRRFRGGFEEVLRRVGISPSTVSRSCAKVLRSFNLTLTRRNGAGDILGEPTYLHLERTVHQLARRLGHRPLRLEATDGSAPVIAPASGAMLSWCRIGWSTADWPVCPACRTGITPHSRRSCCRACPRSSPVPPATRSWIARRSPSTTSPAIQAWLRLPGRIRWWKTR